MQDKDRASDVVVTHRYRLFLEGRFMRRNGRPRPGLAHDGDVESDAFYRWLGYGVETGREVLGRKAVMEALGVRDP